MFKSCTRCEEEKYISEFGYIKNKNRYRTQCKKCLNNLSKSYKKKNKKEISAQRKDYRTKNKSKIQEYQNQYNSSYYENNKIEIIASVQEYSANNKQKIALYQKNYRIKNIEKISNVKNAYRRNKTKNDPYFRLRQIISSAVRRGLKVRNSSKRSKSSLEFLPFTIQELKTHLENQFEPWMTWENQGTYDSQIWNDNDSTTWTWQLDHIIPHSTFKYKTMDCHDFINCWSLLNLRPLSAKQNLLDGVTRIRHER